MKYYPVNLDIRNRACLVVGGGGVGTRKVLGLLRCGALVHVVSPEVTEKILDLASENRIVLKRRGYRSSDLEGKFLVIGATSDMALNRGISRDAEHLNMLCNIADVPDVCNFILPSVVNRGDLILAISTSGRSPAFAKDLRRQLESQFGPEYAEFLDIMGAIRKRLLQEAHEPEAHKPLFERLIAGGLLGKVKNGESAAIDSLLHAVLGEGYTLASLMGVDADA